MRVLFLKKLADYRFRHRLEVHKTKLLGVLLSVLVLLEELCTSTYAMITISPHLCIAIMRSIVQSK